MRFSNFILLLTALGLLLCLHPARAAASKDNCTGFINSVPAVISTPGTWCLSQNVTTSIASGDAITVASDDVVIDCNDFAIDGSAAGLATGAIGIFKATQNRTVIRHCSIRGFYRGIQFNGDSSRDLIEDNHLDQNTHAGISVLTTDSIIRHNLVTRTGGGTATPSSSFGILAAYNTGPEGHNDLIDNTVAGVQASPFTGTNYNAFGIYSGSLLDGFIVRGNTVSGLVPSGGGAWGIYAADGTRGSVRNNELVMSVTASFSVSLDCSGTNGETLRGVRVRNNVMSGFQDPYYTSDCGDAGRNDFNP